MKFPHWIQNSKKEYRKIYVYSSTNNNRKRRKKRRRTRRRIEAANAENIHVMDKRNGIWIGWKHVSQNRNPMEVKRDPDDTTDKYCSLIFFSSFIFFLLTVSFDQNIVSGRILWNVYCIVKYGDRKYSNIHNRIDDRPKADFNHLGR